MDVKPFNVTKCIQWAHYLLKHFVKYTHKILESPEQWTYNNSFEAAKSLWSLFDKNIIVIKLSWDAWGKNPRI